VRIRNLPKRYLRSPCRKRGEVDRVADRQIQTKAISL